MITYPGTYKGLLIFIVLVILLSPFVYWSTGVGQAAPTLSAEIGRLPDGSLTSSPKAEALHRLTLPMRLERLFVYPLLLLAFQFSGSALALRRWLENRAVFFPARRVGRWLSHRLPAAWRERLAGRELWLVFLFVLVFNLGLALLYLPFNFYRSFIVGHQFGLAAQTAAGWLADWGKALLIGLALDSLLWTGFYGLLRLFPRRWPAPGGALLILTSVVLVLLSPVLITPLFYEVRPLEDPDLRARILTLAERAGMEIEAVEVINASAKTTQVNAYFTGFGGAQRIVLYDTLLAAYPPDQVEVVLAHEMGHWYYGHVLLGLVGLGAAGWLGLFALRWLLDRVWRPLGLAGPADVAGLPYILAVAALISLLTMPVENAFSRYGERQADEFALVTSQKPAAFVEFFEKLAVQNLSVVDAPAWEKLLFYTHPSLAERIRMAEALRTRQTGGG